VFHLFIWLLNRLGVDMEIHMASALHVGYPSVRMRNDRHPPGGVAVSESLIAGRCVSRHRNASPVQAPLCKRHIGIWSPHGGTVGESGSWRGMNEKPAGPNRRAVSLNDQADSDCSRSCAAGSPPTNSIIGSRAILMSQSARALSSRQSSSQAETATPIVWASLPREVEVEARADAALIKNHADEALSRRTTWNHLHDIESAGTSRLTNDLMVTVRLAVI
jgi:hypothetical protein